MKKVSELELHEIDYLVALAEKLKPFLIDNECQIPWTNEKCIDGGIYSPTTNPSQAWPIIEREKIQITYDYYHKSWYAFINEESIVHHGKTSLEAAMRCFVASVYGDEVEI